MFTHPDAEWELIKKEHSNPGRIYLAYICILGLIGPVCAFISTTQFGWRVGDGELIKLTTMSSLQLNVLTYVAILVGVFGLGWMIDWMSRTYGSGHDEYAANGIALAAYACTPLFLVGFVSLYPVPWVNMLAYLAAAAYTGYLIYDGLPHVLGISKERAFMFCGAILAVGLVYLVITRVGTVIIWSLGFAPAFVSG
jgi:hypothetical protein